jgi:hypothetical protein
MAPFVKGTQMTRRGLVKKAAIVGAGLTAMAVPAHAATTQTQTLDGVIASTVSITAPAAVNFYTFTLGANSTGGGSMTVTANVPYTVTLAAQKATMTEWVSGAYVSSSPKTLAAGSVITLSSTDVGASPVGAVTSTVSALPIATGLSGTHTYTVSVAQAISTADAPAAYHNLLTYTAAATL